MSSDLHPDLVPELLVTDVAASLSFWCGMSGFRVLYDRPSEGFSYISLGSTAPILSALRAVDWPLFMEPEMRSYQVDGREVIVEQFLVTDPDGYLVRFSSRPAADAR